MIGSGLRSVSHAKSSSGASFGNGCSTNRTFFSLSHDDLVERLLPVLPALVGVRRQRLVGDRPDRLDHFVVVLATELHLQHLVFRRLAHLLPDDLRRVDADGEAGVGRLRRVEAPDVEPGLVHQLSDQIVQRDVDRGLRGRVSRRDRDRCPRGWSRVRMGSSTGSDRPSPGTPRNSPGSRRDRAASTPRRSRRRRRRRSRSASRASSFSTRSRW